MNGLSISEKYFFDVGLPEIEKNMPELLEKAAFGSAGEGSDNLGYDDELSRDHDWGPGFSIWLSKEDMAELGDRTREVYNNLPKVFMGLPVKSGNRQTDYRVGPDKIESFYARLTGLNGIPETEAEWMNVSEAGLAQALSGRVFMDRPGRFTEIRNRLLEFYPHDVILKKLAGHLAKAAQSGQYNYVRCQIRNDQTASFMALYEFISHVQGAIFLLNRKYMPYYKWTNRRLSELDILGRFTAPRLDMMARDPSGKSDMIESISDDIIRELRREGLSASASDYLFDHAIEIQKSIGSDYLRRMDLFRIGGER